MFNIACTLPVECNILCIVHYMYVHLCICDFCKSVIFLLISQWQRLYQQVAFDSGIPYSQNSACYQSWLFSDLTGHVNLCIGNSILSEFNALSFSASHSNCNATLLKYMYNKWIIFDHDTYNVYTVRNVRKFTKFLCYKGNVKFKDIYDVVE